MCDLDNVLLIDGSGDLMAAFGSGFWARDRVIYAARTALEAYEAFIGRDIHLVLTSDDLPDRDVAQVIATLRRQRRHSFLPIIVFTDEDGDDGRWERAGADHVIRKGRGAEQMQQRVEELIAEYRRNRPGNSVDEDMRTCIVEATVDVFGTLLELRAEPGSVEVSRGGFRSAEVIGSLGVAGFVSGSISLFLSMEMARRIAGKMLLVPAESVSDEDLVDAVGELTNVIGGSIKTALCRRTPLFDISVPSVYCGEEVRHRCGSGDLCFSVPFTVDSHEFAVELLLLSKDGGAPVAPSSPARRSAP
ncbi:MAG: hypothetical protein Fur0037_24840 [Planctomycetota bacterium]